MGIVKLHKQFLAIKGHDYSDQYTSLLVTIVHYIENKAYL